MPYFECESCGQLADLERHDQSRLRDYCPSCEETTTWAVAFTADDGVSF